MTLWEAGLVVLAGVGAGTINTIVGSGTLITFPTLIALGFSPVTANVSNCIGLAVGGVSGVWGYRRELGGLGTLVRALVPLTAVGAGVGALLLLRLPESVFAAVVPVLIALSLVLVVAQPRLTRALRERDRDPDAPLSARRLLAVRVGVTATGTYGGYFGAAQGILLVGLLGTLLPIALQRVNALKNVLATSANAVAAAMFLIFARESIAWGVVGLIIVGSLAGGWLGARVGRRLPAPALRAVIVVVGCIALARLVTT